MATTDAASATSTEAVQDVKSTTGNVNAVASDSKTPLAETEEHSRLQELQSDEEKKLLDAVDSLRDYGLGRLTDLPQLIVCGGQSTGKSSLLEAISGVPFPRNVSLCTRFATEVVLRRDRSSWIRVSIIPGPNRPDTVRDRLKEFQHRIKSVGELSQLVEKAMQAMGLLDGSGSEFSPDTLKVEVFGPAQPQVTIVDLPGLIQSIADGKEEADIRLVDNIVTGYMKNPRSVILAVIAANNDPANQLVLQKAKAVDPNGQRTLGIITKPDLISGPDERNLILKYARNEVRAFKLGWHVVRNPSTQDASKLSAADHDKLENEFFRGSAFKPDVSRKLDIGVVSLRKRLSKVLFEQIRDNLPSLVKDIESGIGQCKEELRQLGPGRPTPADQKEYLVTVSQEFLTLTRSAIRGVYEDKFFNDKTKPGRKLCAVLMNLHESFAEKLRSNGSKWKIIDDNDSSWFPSPDKRTRTQAIDAAKDLLKDNRGRELPGLPGPAIIHELFVEYSSPWRQMGLDHIRDIQLAIEVFLQEALEYIGGDDLARKVQEFWLDDLLDGKVEVAKMELEKLLSVQEELPMTFNPAFQRKILELFSKKAQDGLAETLTSKFGEKPVSSAAALAELLKSAGDLRTTGDSNRDAAELAFDVMQVHYQIASDLYIDNVPTLAIWAPLIRSLPTMFSPGEVFKMDEELVKQVAGDSEEIEALRGDLTRRLGILNVGLKETSRHVSRSILLATRNASRNGASKVDSVPSKEVSLFPSTSNRVAPADQKRPANEDWPAFRSPNVTPTNKPTQPVAVKLPQTSSTFSSNATPSQTSNIFSSKTTSFGSFGSVPSSAPNTSNPFGQLTPSNNSKSNSSVTPKVPSASPSAPPSFGSTTFGSSNQNDKKPYGGFLFGQPTGR